MGRAGPRFIFEWAGPGRPTHEKKPGRAGPGREKKRPVHISSGNMESAKPGPGGLSVCNVCRLERGKGLTLEGRSYFRCRIGCETQQITEHNISVSDWLSEAEVAA